MHMKPCVHLGCISIKHLRLGCRALPRKCQSAVTQPDMSLISVCEIVSDCSRTSPGKIHEITMTVTLFSLPGLSARQGRILSDP